MRIFGIELQFASSVDAQNLSFIERMEELEYKSFKLTLDSQERDMKEVELRNEIAGLRKTVGHKSQTIDWMAKDRRKAADKIKHLEAALKEIQSEFGHALEENKSLDHLLKSNRLKVECDSLRDALKRCNEDYAAVRAECDRLAAANVKLAQDWQTVAADNVRLSKNLESASATIKVQRECLDTRCDELAANHSFIALYRSITKQLALARELFGSFKGHYEKNALFKTPEISCAAYAMLGKVAEALSCKPN